MLKSKRNVTDTFNVIPTSDRLPSLGMEFRFVHFVPVFDDSPGIGIWALSKAVLSAKILTPEIERDIH